MKIVYKNKYFKIKKKNGYYIYVPFARQVCIVPVIEYSSFLIVKVKRPHLKKYIYEFPAGSLLSNNENPKKAALRELVEETGVCINKQNKLKKLPSIFSMADRLQNPMFTYYINLNKNQLKKNRYDKREINSVKIVNFAELNSMILKGKFNASVPISLLYIYFLKNLSKSINLNNFYDNIKNSL